MSQAILDGVDLDLNKPPRGEGASSTATVTSGAPLPAQITGTPTVLVPRTNKGTFAPGRKVGTRNREQAQAARNLSIAVRIRIPPEIFIEYNIALAMGKSPVLIEDDDGKLHVRCETKGAILPTLEQRIQAMNRLELRGHGQPVQSIQLEADLRAHSNVTVNLPRGALPASAIIAMRELARLSKPGAGALQGVIRHGPADEPALEPAQ